MITSKLEVLVEFGPKPDEALLNKTLNQLKSTEGVKEAIYREGAVVVETTLPSDVVVDIASKVSGKRTVLQGFGVKESGVAAVAGGGCRGVVRLAQSEEALLVDGTVDGLCGTHAVTVRLSGDLSQGCKSLGDVYQPGGDLGLVAPDDHGRAQFRILTHHLKLSEIIGRSIAFTPTGNSTNGSGDRRDSDTPVACGIIARSAGIFENPKRVCACDGVLVWDERDRPSAGKGRRDEDRCCAKGTTAKSCCT